MKKAAFVLILCWFCSAQPTAVDDVVESCLMKILKKYFLKKPVLLVMDPTPGQHEPSRSLLPNLGREFDREIVRKIMAKKLMVQVYNSNKYLSLAGKPSLNKVKNCFLFIRAEVSASGALLDWEMDKLHRNPFWDPTGRNLVVVRAGTSTNDSEALARRIVEKMWTKSKAIDNLVVVAEADGTVQFYTWFPYRQPDCDRVKQVVRLDTFSEGRFQRKSHLFPAKVAADLQGCELRGATDTCIPYVFADANNASKFVSGVEINIVDTLSKSLNFRLTTVRPQDMWTTSINESLRGAFRLLVDQDVDMAFSCLMLNHERYLLALALPSYYEDSLVWFVPSPSFTTHATDIFYTFSLTFWFLMISVTSSSAVLVGIMSYNEHAEKGRGTRAAVGNVVKLIGVSLYCPVEIPTKNYTFRLLVFALFLYAMHLTIAFQSSLFALYQQPHYNLFYSSLKQAVDSGLFVYLRSSSQELYNQTDHALWNKILQPGRFDYLTDFGEVFSEIAFDKTAVALFIKTTGIYMISVYFTDEFGTPQIFWLRQKFASYPVTIYLSPGNPLYPHFENQLHRLLASGLVRLWLKRSLLTQELLWSNEVYVNNPLSMAHVGGAFFLLLLLLATATLTFLGEVLTFSFLKKGKERKKPGHRHFFLPVKVKDSEGGAVTVRVGHAGSQQSFVGRE